MGASLDEHLLRLSLRHALRRRDYRCEFYASRVDGTNQQALLLSWGWSIGQRFLLNEPATILIGKLVPMLLSSELCHALTPCCTEACGEGFAWIVDALVTIWRSLKA